MTDLNISSIKINWFTTMAKPQVDHIKAVLDRFYTDKIDLSDLTGQSEDRITPAFYTRALAAYYLHIMLDVGIEESCGCVTDGYNDNGIDAIYYDEEQRTLHLVQSKLINAGSGEPDNGEISKFKQGVEDVIDGNFDSRFNNKILSKQQIIKDALMETTTKLNICLVYSGKGFSEHNKRTIDSLMEKLNDTIEWAYFTDFNLKTIHSTLSNALSAKPIDYEITLANWGSIDDPYKTYYGQISAYDLANLYMINGKKLFDENIRSFIGLSTINSEITKTIQGEPENFIYFNNGVTLICNKIEPIPGKIIKRNTGGFACQGIQIINGAQTVGTLGTALASYPEQLKKCVVFVRLIPLDECPEEFGKRITIASNTQNKIEKRDFVSLDPIQHNLRTDLALLGITYHYKRTDDPVPYDDKNCSLEEATVALAAYSEDISNCVFAKREIGKLWDDIKLPPYTLLFNESVKGYVMWNVIKIYRGLSKHLNVVKDSKTSREKSTYTYGNYFVLHIFFRIVPKEKILNPNEDLEGYIESAEFKSIAQKIIDCAFQEGEKEYPSSLIHQLYRNFTKCKDLKEKVLALYQTS